MLPKELREILVRPLCRAAAKPRPTANASAWYSWRRVSHVCAKPSRLPTGAHTVWLKTIRPMMVGCPANPKAWYIGGLCIHLSWSGALGIERGPGM